MVHENIHENVPRLAQMIKLAFDQRPYPVAVNISEGL